MPRIRCHYEDCVFLDEGFCGAASVEIDPDSGCLTYSTRGDADEAVKEDWDEEAEDELAEEEELYEDDEEEEEDYWDDEDDDED